MMIVVKFRAVQKWKVIAGVIIQCGDNHNRHPKQGCRYVSLHDQKTSSDR